MNAQAHFLNSIEQSHRLEDMPPEHSFPFIRVGANPRHRFRVPLQETAQRRFESLTGIEASMPFGRADRAQEMLDGRGVLPHVLDEEIAWVPIDQNSAQVEDDVADA